MREIAVFQILTFHTASANCGQNQFWCNISLNNKERSCELERNWRDWISQFDEYWERKIDNLEETLIENQ